MFLFNARGAGCCDIFCVSTDCLQSSDTNIDKRAASLSRALERNTTLHTLNLSGECAANLGVFDFVAACVILHGLDQGLCCDLLCLLSEFRLCFCSMRGARVVVIVFASPLTACNHQTQT